MFKRSSSRPVVAARVRRPSHRAGIEALESRQMLTITPGLHGVQLPPITNSDPFSTTINAPVAHFKVAAEDRFTVTINWDDKTPEDSAAGGQNIPVRETYDGREWTAATDSSAFLGDEPPQVDDVEYDVIGSHHYAQSGTYQVTTTVSDTHGDSDTMHTTVVLNAVTPTLALNLTGTQSPEMYDRFGVQAVVTELGVKAPVTLPLTYSYSLAANAAMPGDATGGATISVTPSDPTTPATADLHSFQYSWPWIPKRNPLSQNWKSSIFDSYLGTTVGGVHQPDGAVASTWFTGMVTAAGNALKASTNLVPIIGDLNTLIGALAVIPENASLMQRSQQLTVTAKLTSPEDSSVSLARAEKDVTITVPSLYQELFAASTAASATSSVLASASLGVLTAGKFASSVISAIQQFGASMFINPGNAPQIGAAAWDTLWKAATAFGGAIAWAKVAQDLYTEAADPPDPDYKVMATLAPPSPTDPAVVAGNPDATAYIAALEALTVDVDAATQSRDRASGARDAGDPAWEATQLAAAATFDADATAQLVRLDSLSDVTQSLAELGLQAVNSAGTAATPAAPGAASPTPGLAATLTPAAAGQAASASAMDTLAHTFAALASTEITQAVSLRTGTLGQAPSPVSLADRQALDSASQALAASQAGGPAGATLTAASAYEAEAMAVANSTNNLAGVQADLDAAQGALGKLADAAQAAPGGVRITSPTSPPPVVAAPVAGPASPPVATPITPTTAPATSPAPAAPTAPPTIATPATPSPTVVAPTVLPTIATPTTPPALTSVSPPVDGPISQQEVSSLTRQGKFVANLYTRLLDRLPEPTGLAFWTGELKSGVSPKLVARGIWASAERQRTHPHLRASAVRPILRAYRASSRG